ncbi:T-cell surface glycoprotein CD1b4-like [Rana temporaria]|uniref:T-cell surface glycoprotein CD1b4-like n=1 Tax=Rana temporaria TaxID=8407 RepID=UPI001AAD85E0|nr:T-cell surface glycoprotein CD1b4-like [Rana temporaria]
MIKILIMSLTLSLHLFLIATATDIRINWLQNYYYSSDRVLTLWGSLVVEDIEILAAYNDSRFIVFKQSWSKGNLSNTDWMFFNMFLGSFFYYFQLHIDDISEELEIKGAFITQCVAICPSSTDNPAGYAFKIALEGEDLVHLNVTEGVWVAGDYPYSEAVQKHLQKDKVTLVSIENMLKNQCHAMATKYSTAGKEALSRKIQPQVYITKKVDKAETEVICMVTGFYPKPINVSLWKEKKIEDVMSTVTLPNGDGTYQITVLTITNLIEQESIYCQVEHSSLKEPIIVHLG